ncbi:hypothetical protein [Actinokineospora enzanensis]|uniref:hypothetical protein n=1 Tax=Actinokineospora enzanensis TaxID=155975 RepID=UPI00037A1B3D|nr:hypothetical protein [Actinokineospora enzanensis]
MTGRAHADGVEMTVHPGGALESLHLTESALRRPDLATTILRVVDAATADANRRARHLIGAVPAHLLGLDCPETTEATTPETWRAQ